MIVGRRSLRVKAKAPPDRRRSVDFVGRPLGGGGAGFRAVPAIDRDRLEMLLERARERVAAGAVGDEVEEVRARRRDGGRQRLEARIADGTRRQARRRGTCCKRSRSRSRSGRACPSTCRRASARRSPSGPPGGACRARAGSVDAGDDRPLAVKRGFLLDDRGERRPPARAVRPSGLRALAHLRREVPRKLREHRLDDLARGGRARHDVRVGKEEALEVRRAARDRGRELRVGEAPSRKASRPRRCRGSRKSSNVSSAVRPSGTTTSVRTTSPRPMRRMTSSIGMGRLEPVLAGLQRRGAARDAVVDLGEAGVRDDAFGGEPAEDLRRSRCRRKEDRRPPPGRAAPADAPAPVEEPDRDGQPRASTRSRPRRKRRRPALTAGPSRRSQVVLEEDGRGLRSSVLRAARRAAARRAASSDVSVSSWKRTGRPAAPRTSRRRSGSARERALDALGGAGEPKTTSSTSSSRQKRASSSRPPRSRLFAPSVMPRCRERPGGVRGRQADPLSRRSRRPGCAREEISRAGLTVPGGTHGVRLLRRPAARSATCVPGSRP